MTDLQKKLLEMLKVFIKVCDDNNLRYFLSSGTTLGAVRHHGFIPWDDDIDVMMPREDYEKLMSLKHPFDDNRYFLQCYKTDPHYILNYGKLRDSSTTFIENNYAHHKINHGVWIDIFPIDGRSKKIKPNRFKAKIQNLRFWANVWLCYPYAFRRKFRLKYFFTDLMFNLIAFIFFPLNVFLYRNRLVDWWCTRVKYDEATYVGMIGDFYINHAMWPKEWTDDKVMMQFEDVMAAVPKEYDKYLTFIYGDYMKLPPIEKQVGHHHDKGFSLTVGYKDYKKSKKNKSK